MSDAEIASDTQEEDVKSFTTYIMRHSRENVVSQVSENGLIDQQEWWALAHHGGSEVGSR